MPRVADVYSVPAGTDGISNGTISSSKYNGFVHDVESDLNLARPILAGGTGATSAAGARDNLDAEVALQVVTNYDTHVWEAGSFKSAIGAISAPNGSQNFSGICHLFDATSCFIEARAYEGNQERYFRRKYAGTWQPWTSNLSLAGDLKIDKSSPFIYLDKPAGSNAMGIQTSTDDKVRWSVQIGNSDAETGSNAGSNFAIYRFDDTGTIQLGTSLTINRASGAWTIDGAVTTGGGISSAGDIKVATTATSGNGGSYHFGNTGTKYLTYDGTNFGLNGGALNLTHPNLVVGAGGPSATIFFGSSAGKYFTFDGSQYTLVGAQLNVSSGINTSGGNIYIRAVDAANNSHLWYQDQAGANAFVTYWNRAQSSWDMQWMIGGPPPNLSFLSSGVVRLSNGFASRNGIAGSYQSYAMNFHYNANVYSFVDNTNMGIIQFVSDYRTKKDVEDLPGTWETVKALRPIKYTQAEYTPDSATAPLFIADDKERWGFIAHELQDTLIEDAATGHKDASGLVQSPNPWTMIAALTKALQEAMARIEALEARQ